MGASVRRGCANIANSSLCGSGFVSFESCPLIKVGPRSLNAETRRIAPKQLAFLCELVFSISKGLKCGAILRTQQIYQLDGHLSFIELTNAWAMALCYNPFGAYVGSLRNCS